MNYAGGGVANILFLGGWIVRVGISQGFLVVLSNLFDNGSHEVSSAHIKLEERAFNMAARLGVHIYKGELYDQDIFYVLSSLTEEQAEVQCYMRQLKSSNFLTLVLRPDLYLASDAQIAFVQ